MTILSLVGLAILGVVFWFLNKIARVLLHFIALGAMFIFLIMVFKGVI